jgi:aspartate/methionine/tyrosine aminotransferase
MSRPTTSCIPGVLQLPQKALTECKISSKDEIILQNNRIVLQDLNHLSIRAIQPQGTCLPDFRAYSNDSVELARFLLRKTLVVTVPGKEFGMEGHLRLSYAGSVKDITVAVERIKWALDLDSPNEIYLGDRKMIRDWL